MRTIKQVSDLTGISIRMLHYYDKIGLLKPSRVTDAGYRLYDGAALEALQQILFFRELDVPLKQIKEILQSPRYDKVKALKKQQELLILRRDRLDTLIEAIRQKLDGGDTMSFKEFDLSGYYEVLETFKREHEEVVEQYFGGAKEFDKKLAHMKSNEMEIAKMAMKQFGSIEAYTKAIENNLANLPSIMEGFESIKENTDVYLAKTEQLTKRLTADLGRNPSSPDIQEIVKEMDDMVKEQSEIVGMAMGENYWGLMAELYLTKPEYAKITDQKYGKGASQFIGRALTQYSQSVHPHF